MVDEQSNGGYCSYYDTDSIPRNKKIDGSDDLESLKMETIFQQA